MSNVDIVAPLIDGGLMPYTEYGDACKYAVELITGDDLRPPARNVTITVKTKSGKTVKVIIPNSVDVHDQAIVQIDGETV